MDSLQPGERKKIVLGILLVAAAIALVLNASSIWWGLESYGQDIEAVADEVRPELRSMYWGLTGKAMRIENTSVGTSIEPVNASIDRPPGHVPRFNVTVLDDTVRAGDPAVLRFDLANTDQGLLQVEAGVFWPFGWLTASGPNSSFILWSDGYEDELGHDVPGYNVGILPATGSFEVIRPGEETSWNYTIEAGIPGVQPGSYTTSESLTFRSGVNDYNLSERESIPHYMGGTGYRMRFSVSFDLR